MTEFELKSMVDANWIIKSSPEGFEGHALLRAWNEQLRALLNKQGVTCAEINLCIVRLSEIAKEVTINSRPEIEEQKEESSLD